MEQPNANEIPGTPVPPQAQQPAGETMIPKYRFDEVSKRAQEAEAKVAELTAQVQAIKEKDDRIAALEKELADTKTSYELEKSNAKRQQAIDNALRDKAVDSDVVNKLLDLDKISIDDKGNLKGLDEQIKELQTSKPFLWKPVKQVVKPAAADKPQDMPSFAKKLAEAKKAQLSTTSKSKTYF